MSDELDRVRFLREVQETYRREVELGHKRLRAIEAIIEELIEKEKETLNNV